ncbi:MAG: DNA-directed RNA polymerase subunit alpha [Patescibacteria group bacterium]|mgnify:CR=1 FL=1
MELIPLPTKLEYTPGSKPNETILTIEPLYPGYGITLGIAMRRVLLSSLEGGAIVAVKIKGVTHEFSTLPYVKEDVVDLILNLKQLRFKVHTDETVKLTLKAKGEKQVTAADIEPTQDVEIANPGDAICSLTNKNAQLEMDLFVRKGRGYLPTEAREKEKEDIGTITVDAIFTPIRNVGVRVENVRVGQMTTYNKIVLAIETDGSISAEDAVKQAASVLVEQFQFLLGKQEEAASEEGGENVEEQPEFSDLSENHADEEVVSSEEEIKEPKKRGRPRKGL